MADRYDTGLSREKLHMMTFAVFMGTSLVIVLGQSLSHPWNNLLAYFVAPAYVLVAMHIGLLRLITRVDACLTPREVKRWQREKITEEWWWRAPNQTRRLLYDTDFSKRPRSWQRVETLVKLGWYPRW